ncbi:DUF1810 domain-containing protein [Luteibacter aegosomatis]|uniref:DUF1810 domain-containing protein n=1 Tax=Luteibacter aegosomatis TaxID=2911537 RepID=UPI001FFA836D|nr:DUF1810 domain-containing protein [Luteibacter aegosomatis]UPG83918.1 DUF1810 domain-containing protein [Luteibacter aegosomatis]
MNDISLDRFLDAQENTYERALRELRSGQKKTHWMWFVFPQVRGLGTSERSSYFGIDGKAEACEYLEHPILGERLILATSIVLHHTDLALVDIFPYPDDLKFISCMTLFASAAPERSEFDQAIQRFADGRRDERTLHILQGGQS